MAKGFERPNGCANRSIGARQRLERAMAAGLGFPDRKVIAELTAKMLLEVEAVRFMGDKPFIFTSGRASPVYTDCRRLISFPRVRRSLIDFGAATVLRDVGFEQIDAVAGGETAGIPFAAWMADRLELPMQYVRKKPKGFGRNAQIEGHLVEGQRVLLVEDMTSDGGSKVNFCNALRQAGATVEHVFVIFFYDIFPESKKILGDLGVKLHALATWWDVLAAAKESGKFDAAKLAEVEKFMHDPTGWSKAHGGAAQAAE
jgi:orotate phosphoribosyltransferase